MIKPIAILVGAAVILVASCWLLRDEIDLQFED